GVSEPSATAPASAAPDPSVGLRTARSSVSAKATHTSTKREYARSSAPWTTSSLAKATRTPARNAAQRVMIRRATKNVARVTTALQRSEITRSPANGKAAERTSHTACAETQTPP